MRNVRPPAVAGFFYSSDSAELAGSVEANLGSPLAWDIDAKAIVAPHAGYIYSGPIAGTAYSSIQHQADRIKRVVLLGPAHRLAFRGIAASSAAAHATPIGAVPVDWTALRAALMLPEVEINDAAFEGEHALEVHLPFLQQILGEFTVVPLLVGSTSTQAVDRVLQALWGGPETLIVISSDLSHFHSYRAAQRLDLKASRAIEALDDAALDGELACGHRPLAGLLMRAAELDLRPTTLDLRNSADTAGGRDRVVGYGAYAFEYAENARLPERLRASLIEAADKSILHGIRFGKCADVDIDSYGRPLQALRRTFVTVRTDGQLRGCVGSIAPAQTLVEDVVQNAFKAAFHDNRFAPLTESELAATSVSVSIMSTPREMQFFSEAGLLEQLRPGADGLIIEDRNKRALFLPAVWEQVRSPAEFVARLKQKAGLPAGHWSDDFRAWRFATESFGAPFDA